MPCVCGNGRIIRGTEIHAAADHIKQPILHLTALLTVHEHAETFHCGPHIHACQKRTIPRLLLELAFVDPPAVDGRQTIDDVSTDCEFRVGGRFREMDRGYGKLSSWDRITERADATLIAASGSHVRASDDSAGIDDEHSRRLPVRHAHHSLDLNRRPQFSRQLVFALHCIPTAAITETAGVFDQHHHAGADDRETLRIVQGYGKLLLRVEDVDSHGDAIAQRRAAGVPCDKLKSFCRMTVRNHRDVVERRHFVFSVVHQL